MFGKEPRGIQNLVHPEVLIWRKANEVDVRLNACSTEHAAVSSGERKLFSKKIKQHLADFKRLLKNLGPEYSLEYKLNYGEEGEQRASELDEKVIDDLAEKGIKDFLIVRKFGPEEIFQDDFVDEIREIMVEKYWPLYTFSLKEGPFDIEELTYFILQTGGGEYEDEPERRYHFKQGIPGSVQLRNAENKGKFVYYENGKFYGKGDIGKITSYEEDGVTYYYVEIKNFQRIKPIDINYVGGDLSFDSVGQAGIRRISREDYDTIFTFVPMPKLKRFNLQPSELKNMCDLQLPAELFDQICRALNAGKHIILTGPVGTGKTDLAKGIGEAAKALGYSRGYILTTATSDWTTFDTIGGYMPESSRGLTFQQGAFLDALQNNQMLIIDEINRADIDKAFGQLFTVLSGQPVKLPFRLYGKIISINPGEHIEGGFDEESASYRVGKNWRIVATMNVYDKNFLYEMSYAFMRRFAFIYVDIPKEEYYEKLVDSWAGDSISEDTKKGLMKLTKLGGRRIGPAVIKDIVDYLKMAGNREIERLAEAVVAYILPQLEGIEKAKMEEAWRKIGKQVFKNNIEIANTKVKPIFEEIMGIKLEDVSEDGA